MQRLAPCLLVLAGLAMGCAENPGPKDTSGRIRVDAPGVNVDVKTKKQLDVDVDLKKPD